MEKLYQKTSLRNEIVGRLLQLMTFLAIFYLETCIFDHFLYQFCKTNPLLQLFGITFETLMELPPSFLYNLFLLYWLNRYINEHIRPIDCFGSAKRAGFALLLTLLSSSGNFLQNLLPSSPKIVWQLITLVLSLLIGIFVQYYVFYRALGFSNTGQALRYGQFMKQLFRFIRANLHLYLANIGANAVVLMLEGVVLFYLQFAGVDIWSLLWSFPAVYISGSIISIATVITPLTQVKIFTAFADCFADTQNSTTKTESPAF